MSWPGDSVGPEPTIPTEPGRLPLIALLGPTATGKTAAAVTLCEQLGGEIESSLPLEAEQLGYADEVNLLRLGSSANVVLSSSTSTATRSSWSTSKA